MSASDKVEITDDDIERCARRMCVLMQLDPNEQVRAYANEQVRAHDARFMPGRPPRSTLQIGTQQVLCADHNYNSPNTYPRWRTMIPHAERAIAGYLAAQEFLILK